jgi:sarcosine oxidase subunit alpha
MTAYRVPGRGRVDPEKPISFSFDGKSLDGMHGDTLASALLANGIHFVGRSFKYHRPRGILSAGSEEPNALVAIERGTWGGEPNVRATTQELFPGLKAASQNRWPNLLNDFGATIDLIHGLFPAGFYYKTFMWPRSFWTRVYEPIIRRTAGLGRAPTMRDPDRYTARYAHCDTLIVGAGPAGLSAAISAAKSGARVIIADEQAEIGGSLLADPAARIDNTPAWDWLENCRRTLDRSDNVTVLPRTTAIGYYHQNYVGLAQRLTDHLASPPAGAPRERLWRIRARRVVLAQGAIERPLLFPGNDRPGIMLAGASRQYLTRYGTLVGRRPVVATSHDSAYLAAFDMAEAGANVVAIVDLRPQISQSLEQRAQDLGIEILKNSIIIQTAGRHRVRSVKIGPATRSSGPDATHQNSAAVMIACDAVLMSGGWTASAHLFSQAGGKLEWNEDVASFLPSHDLDSVHLDGVRCVGACNGTYALDDALHEGAEAGANSTARTAGNRSEDRDPKASPDPTALEEDRHGRIFVDFQNDVTEKDIRLAVREGFHSIEHVKRYTTTGMATDQGKTSNINGLSVVAQALGRRIPDVGLTTFRPPFTPTTFGALAGNKSGDLFEVTRKTPVDSWAQENGAVFEPVGQWRRAHYFPQDGEDMHAAVRRECRVTRETLGLFDASTLGKIEVTGPDAGEFLNRMYTNPMSSLKHGRCRYGLLLGEDGFIRDDGVVARCTDDLFHVTTTTGAAARTLELMEDYLQTEWPELRVWLTSTTDQWAVIAVNGPNARKLLEPFVEGIDLSSDAFPHMSIREGKICDVPTRLFRVSFTGELGFEVNIPARYGRSIWSTLMDAGRQYGAVPYGTETMHVLRAEKGYIIVGQDTDGTVTPDDAGLGWAIGKNKSDFVGMRSLARSDISNPNRKQIVGLLTEDPSARIEEGAQIVLDPGNANPTNTPMAVPVPMIGHVTSSYWSVALDRTIALAAIEAGRNRIGSEVSIPMPGMTITAHVTGPVFLDPESTRLNA